MNKVKENRDNLTLSVYKKNINAINFYKKNDFLQNPTQILKTEPACDRKIAAQGINRHAVQFRAIHAKHSIYELC